MLTRRGASLVELIVALAVTALMLGAASGSLLRQQRAARWVGGVTRSEGQMRSLAQLMPAELRTLDASTGDVVPGEASDSTIEIRAVVASSLTCDTATAIVVLVPDGIGGTAIGGSSRVPVAGDSLWFYASDSLGWQSRSVGAVSTVAMSCRSPASPRGKGYRLALNASLDAPGGTPVRVTRHERYVIYRASDGHTYLGVRDWSQTIGGFGAPQPVAGPFIRALSYGARTGFQYFDSAGARVTPDGTNERSIARVRVSSLVVVPADAAHDSVRRDSTDVPLTRRSAP